MKGSPHGWPRLVLAFALAFLQITLGRAQPALAAPGDLIADVIVPEAAALWVGGISPSVGLDGRYLYYTDYMGSALHRIDAPPPGAAVVGTGHVDFPIVGAPSARLTLSYAGGRGMFWAMGGDGLSVYQLSKTGSATLQFQIEPLGDRPGYRCSGQYCAETKLNYDRADDTIWYTPDTVTRIWHYQTYPDALGTAVLVAATPYIDVDIAPNDMGAQCAGGNGSSGVATGGAHLFITQGGCGYYFEYTKTGTKVAWHPYVGS